MDSKKRPVASPDLPSHKGTKRTKAGDGSGLPEQSGIEIWKFSFSLISADDAIVKYLQFSK